MAMKVLHKRSTSNNLPTGETLKQGEIAVNYSNADPFLSIRKEDGSYVRISSDEKWNESVANVDKKFDDYLPLSGGTLTGNICIEAPKDGMPILKLFHNQSYSYLNTVGEIQFNNGYATVSKLSLANNILSINAPIIALHDNALYVKDTDKNVGIGTTSPAYKLDVNGGVGIGTESGSDLYLKRKDGNSYIHAADTLAFTTGNKNSSNIALKLNADRSAIFDGNIDMGLHEISNTKSIHCYDSKTGYYVGGRNYGMSVTDGGLLLLSYGETPMSFYTNGRERLTITSDGKIGIGTTNPQYKVDVIGRLRAGASLSTDETYGKHHGFVTGDHGIDNMDFYENEFNFYSNGKNGITKMNIYGNLYIDSKDKSDMPLWLKSKYKDAEGACRVMFEDADGNFQGYVMTGWGSLCLSHRSHNQIGVGDAGIWCSTDNGTTKRNIYHSGNFNPADYLPTSGGTISGDVGALNINRSNEVGSFIGYSGTNGTLGYLGFRDVGIPGFFDANWNPYFLIHSGNIGDYNAGSATKLQTARSIWGQEFDGSGSVMGDLNLIARNDIDNTNSARLRLRGNTWRDGGPYIQGIAGYGYGIARIGFFQTDVLNYTGSYSEVMSIVPNGNVGIGTTDPQFKLDVNGNAALKGVTTFGTDGATDIKLLRSNGYSYITANSHLALSTGNDAGNIAIGINPDKSSDFFGVVNMSNKLNLNGNLHIKTADGGIIIQDTNSDSYVTTNGYIKFNNGYATVSEIALNNNILSVSAPIIALHDNALYVKDTDKNVGIGTTSPEYKLDVNGGVRFGTGSGCDVYLNRTSGRSYITALDSMALSVGGNSGNIAVAIDNGKAVTIFNGLTVSGDTKITGSVSVTGHLTSGKANTYYLGTSDNAWAALYSNYMYAGKNQPLYIGANSTTHITVNTGGSVSFAAAVSAATGFFQTSDETLKDFYEEIDVDFDKLKKIPKRYYKWKSDPNGDLEIGTSAQKVQELYPELVGGEEGEKLSVDYSKLSVIALKAVDKLYEENVLLKAELEMIKKHLGM